MKVVVFGAGCKSGELSVSEAVAAGHKPGISLLGDCLIS